MSEPLPVDSQVRLLGSDSGLARDTQSKDCGGDGIENLTHRSHSFPIEFQWRSCRLSHVAGNARLWVHWWASSSASLPLCHTHGARSHLHYLWSHVCTLQDLSCCDHLTATICVFKVTHHTWVNVCLGEMVHEARNSEEDPCLLDVRMWLKTLGIKA